MVIPGEKKGGRATTSEGRGTHSTLVDCCGMPCLRLLVIATRWDGRGLFFVDLFSSMSWEMQSGPWISHECLMLIDGQTRKRLWWGREPRYFELPQQKSSLPCTYPSRTCIYPDDTQLDLHEHHSSTSSTNLKSHHLN